MNLSTDRSQELAKIYFKWKKVESKRELTENEKSLLMTDALGVSFADAEKAITQKMIGNDQAYEEMLAKAAEVNRTTPEKIGEFLNEMVLEE